MKTIHDQTKNTCFLVFSSFSTHFYPHYIIMDKGPLQMPTHCMYMYMSRGGEGIVRTCTRLKLTTGDRQYPARVSHGTARVIARYTKPIPREREWAWFRDIPWNFAVYYAIQLRNIVACISCWQELRLDSHTQPSTGNSKGSLVVNL